MIAKNPAMTVRSFFWTVYMPLRLTTASKSCIQQMDVAINRFEVFLEREAMLTDLCENTMAAFLADSLARKLSPVTCNMRAKSLSTIWRLAKRKQSAMGLELSDDLEGLSLLRVPKNLPRAWLPEEMDRLLESCLKAHGRLAGVQTKFFWASLLLVLYDTGLRLKAAMEIRFDEIDLTSHMLRVPADRMKNDCEQYFRLSDHTLQVISDASTPAREKVFPFPFCHHRALYDRWRVILRRAGLPSTRNDMFHKIRRTTASNLAMVAGEWSAIQQLGHRNEGTIKRYIDPRFTANHDAARLLIRPGVAIGTVAPSLPDTVPERATGERLAGLSAGMVANVLHPSRSVLEALVAQPTITRADLKRALKAIGMSAAEFAKESGIGPESLRKALNYGGLGEPLTPYMESKVRAALGIGHRQRTK